MRRLGGVSIQVTWAKVNTTYGRGDHGVQAGAEQ
jgi:hypothetical protein